jgi:ABC-type nitrate/sulfonate/bicarbonate transport system permease component
MPEAVRFRGGGYEVRPRRWAPWLVFALLLLLWHVASSRGWISPLFLPSPTSVVRAFGDLIDAGTLQRHLWESARRIGLGWALGTLAGLAVGLSMGIFSLARAGLLPLVSALFPIPKIALLPLFILWFGIGEPSKVATIGFGVFFPTVIAAYAACDQVPRNLIRMAQSFGLPARHIVWKVIVPGAMPGILAGFRITASIALILVVAAEMIGAEHGVGAFILATGNLMQTDHLVAGVAILSTFGLLVNWLLSAIEKSVLRWR